ncbi:MAG: hypothetical protein EXS05_18195 [Planctomycetaceae bacterium]|nr:hypothetical protein [Planctomycetaceae bacterium]
MNTNRLIPAVIAGLMCLGGCAGTGPFKFGKEDFPKAGPQTPVVQIVPLWQASTGVGLAQRTCRGFAGQLLFLVHGNPTPGMVDGTVSVYVFDDQGNDDEKQKPIHKFDFSPEVWSTHAQNSSLGLTYSVFIPYTRPGNHQCHCSLMVRYTPREGPTILSEMVEVELPGTKRKAKPDAGSYENNDVGDDAAEATSAALIPAARDQRLSGRENRPQPELQQMVAQAQALSKHNRSSAARRLSPDDNERILREAQARLLEGQAANGDADDGYESEPAVAPSRRSNRGTLRHPLADADESADNESDEDNEPDVLPVRSTKRRKSPEKGGEGAGQRRHPLEADEAHESASEGHKRPKTLTLSLSTAR